MNVDLLLVVGYFRSATSFLSVARHLSSDLKIAVLPTAASSQMQGKTGSTEKVFLQLCEQFGAKVIDADTDVRARLMIVQQFPYPPEVIAAISRRVVAARRAGLMTLATAGLEKHDQFLKQLDLRKVYVPNRRFMEFLLARRCAVRRYENVEVEEVGLPFRKYPVFPEFTVDWLIAAPTLFSFATEEDKQAFLRTVLALLDQVGEEEVVAYKPHNGNIMDYFAPRVHYALASAIPEGRDDILQRFAASGPSVLRRHAAKTVTSRLHQRLLSRAVPMSALTSYGDISLEAFLPGVRKGVIGGLSNTIWGSLYFGLSYFNCVDRSARRSGRSELIGKSSETLLDVNLEFFGVPFCYGDLSRGARGEGIVLDREREGDLIRSVRCELGRGNHHV